MIELPVTAYSHSACNTEKAGNGPEERLSTSDSPADDPLPHEIAAFMYEPALVVIPVGYL